LGIAQRTICHIRKHLERHYTSKAVPITVKTLGDRIRLARYEKGLDKGELAKTMGISPIRIGLFERDANEPNRQEMQNLEAILGPVSRFRNQAPNT
jgi:ribosome-binding protein aMBF1 (putative translation factor)